MKKHFLSLVAPVKDEDAYLIEFVNYYLLQGVERFYFYNNDSETPLTETLRDYLDVCTIVPFPGSGVQYPCYAHFCATFKHETEWLAVFDIDEFILPHRHETLCRFLHDYADVDGIGINWVMFGDGHHATPPAGKVIESYLYREAEQHDCIKSVIRTDKLLAIDHSHYARLEPGATYVDARFNPIGSAYNRHQTTDIIQLNHYFTKSAEEYHHKIYRRRRVDDGLRRVDHEEDLVWLLDRNEKYNVIRETLIVDKYGKALDEQINARSASAKTSHAATKRLANEVSGSDKEASSI